MFRGFLELGCWSRSMSKAKVCQKSNSRATKGSGDAKERVLGSSVSSVLRDTMSGIRGDAVIIIDVET